ncbi:choice-of-anchor D domain-containing protein [Verrucomicrobiaceae bacterium 227]
MKILLLTFLTVFLALPVFAGIEIRGGTNFNTIISNGDTTPRTTDGTDFGDVTIPGSKTVSFQIKATGSQELITGITEDGAAWSIESGSGFGNLPAGSTRTFTVKMDPTSAGYKTATISIIASTGIYTFKVEGQGLGDPEIVVRGQILPGISFISISDDDTSPRPDDGTSFGSRGVSDGSISHTFQIENTGTAQLTIDSITDNSSEFSVSSVPDVVGVDQIQTFLVKFNPTSYGFKTGIITIQNNDANEDPFTFEVSGTGEASEIAVLGGSSQTISIANGDTTPRTLDNTDFGTVVAGGPTVTKVFKIKNNGNEDLFVTAVTEDANAFSITGAPGPLNPIAPGGSNNFNIILNADVAGPKAGTVTIISNDPDNGVYTFDIEANATGDPEIVVRGQLNPISPYVNLSNGDTTPSPTDGTDFGSHGVSDGYISHFFQIENIGNAKLNIDSITDDSAHFNVVGEPTSVAVGNIQTFEVRFNPGSYGQKTATITIENDDPDGGEDPYTFEVTGLGLASDLEIRGGTSFSQVITHGDTTPRTLDGTDFGTVSAGLGTVTNTFQVKNDGNQNLTFLGASEDGSAFSIASQPALAANIAPGATREFSILFAPTAAGNKSATVTVLTSDPAQPAHTFDISGESDGIAELAVAGRPLPNLSYVDISNGDTTPTSIDGTNFGDKGVSDGGTTHTFQLTNTGSSQLTINSITETSSQFSVSNIPDVVGVNQTKTFDVTFNPSSFGTKSTTINISTNANGEESFTFKVNGDGTAPKILVEGGPTGGRGTIVSGSVDPEAGEHNNFGTIDAGTVRERTFQITNTGNEQLTITGITENGAAWSVSPSGVLTTVPAGGTFDFNVTLAPTSAGPKAAIVTILSSDPDSPFTFEVTGTAAGESGISVSGQTLPLSPFTPVPDGATGGSTGNGTDFGDQGVSDGGIPHTFQITNTGNAQLTIDSIVELSAHFSITDIPKLVGVNQTATFTITFNPTSLGKKVATVTLTSNAPGDLASYTFELVGIGEAPDISVTGGINFGNTILNGDATPAASDGTDFGLVNINASVVTRTFRLENSGNDTLIILGAASNHSDFTLAGVPGITNPIQPGGVNEFTIAFDPSSTGFIESTILIQSSDPDEDPYTFIVEGFGSDDVASINVVGEAGDEMSNGQTLYSASTAFGTAIDINGPSQNRTFTIENDGTGTLTITSVTEDGARFNIIGAPTDPIEPGESADFIVRFNPDTTTPQTATVTIVSNDPDESPFTFNVTGTGSDSTPPPAPEIAVKGGQTLNVNIGNGDTTPRRFDGTDIGSIIVGESKERTFQIRNSGDAVLNISQVILVGAPGAVASFPSSVPAGGTADFTVKLTPSSAGQKTFTLKIESDDADESTFTFDITGLGVDPVNMLSIQGFKTAGKNVEITFVSDPLKSYRIAYSFDLETWNEPSGLTGIPGDVNAQTYIITGVANASNTKAYFRVQVE